MSTKRRGLGKGFDALLGDAGSSLADTAAVDSAADGGTQRQDNELKYLPIDKITRGPYQPRMHFEQSALEELADSIRAQGVLQPIVVRPIGNDYELIAGERRWRAAQLAELQEIPAVVRDLPDQTAAAVALIENIQREDLNPLEEAKALQRLIAEFDMTHQEVSESVGRSRASVSNLLRLLDLADEAKTLLDSGQLDMGHARALLGLSSGKQVELAKQIAAKGLSVRETERQVKQLLQASSVDSKKAGDPDINRLEQELSDQIGAKVQIQHSGSGKGKLIINYKSSDELEGVLQRLR